MRPAAIGCGILSMAVFLLGAVTEGRGEVIYRNNFGNSGTGYLNYNAVHLKMLGAGTATTNVANYTNSTGSNVLGVSPAAGSPNDLPNVEAGSSQSATNGFGLFGSGVVGLAYTDTLTLDRTTTQIDSIQWNGAEYQKSSADIHGAIRVALQIGEQWYVSQAFSLSTASNANKVNIPSADQEALFSAQAIQYSLDFNGASWFTLRATPGMTFQVGSSSISLPSTGNITALGLYVISPGGGGSFFDTLTVNATAVPEAKTNALIGLVGIGMFLATSLKAVRRRAR